jgi:hypothetical protein
MWLIQSETDLTSTQLGSALDSVLPQMVKDAVARDSLAAAVLVSWRCCGMTCSAVDVFRDVRNLESRELERNLLSVASPDDVCERLREKRL